MVKNKKKKKMSVKKKILISVLSVIGALILIVGGYVAYVFLSYSRIPDNQPLTVEGSGKDSVSYGTEYTVLTQNIGFGAYTRDFTFFMDGGEDSRAASEESVRNCIGKGADTAEALSPDFILFQEVDTDSTRSFHVDEAEMLRERFADKCSVFANNWDSAYLMYPILKPHGKAVTGIMTFSDYTITSSLRRSLPISTSLSKIVDLDRCYTVSRIPTEDGKEFIIYNIHMSAYGGSDEIRTGQMNMLFDDMMSEYEKGNYCICGGDYNHDFTGDSVKVLNGEDTEAFGWTQPFPEELIPEEIHRATDYSCKKERPTCRNCDIPYEEGNFTVIVDGFLYTDNIEVTYTENIQTGFEYSDHNPVVMKFILKEAE